MKRALHKRIFVIDVGNTSTAIGLYSDGRILKRGRLATSIREPTQLRAKAAKLVGATTPDGVVLSSVVPEVNKLWKEVVRKSWSGVPMLNLNHRCKLGVPITYPKPETIGADRLANACEAAHRYGTPIIVADFGTAVTFDIISKIKGYIGGIIAPGLSLMFSYLAEKTALLPRVKPGPVRHFVGKSTVEAMRLGAVWGYRGLVREILKELTSRIGEKGVKLCATGGYADWVLRGSGIPMPIDPDLTLRGLGRIYELNYQSLSKNLWRP
jgi:type III pantothenate kinase